LFFAHIEATSSFRAIATYLDVVPRILEQGGASLDREGVMGDILAAVEDGRTELDLSNRKLTELPPELVLAGNLEALSLGQNAFELLPASIGLLSNLQELDLTHNRLKRLPPHIGALSNLETLLAQENELFDLPPQIGHLQKLQHLDVTHNRLTELPREIGWLGQLRELKVGANKLRALPREIGRLTSLKRLSLEDNQIKALPPELALLTHLEDWDFSRRDRLPPRESRALILSGNPLEDPPDCVRGTSAIAAYLSPRLGNQPEARLYKRIPGRTLVDYDRFIASHRNAWVHQILEEDTCISTVLEFGDGRLTVSYDDELELIWSEGIARNQSLL